MVADNKESTFNFTNFISMISPFKVLADIISNVPFRLDDYDVKFEEVKENKYELVFGFSVTNFKDVFTAKDLITSDIGPSELLSKSFQEYNSINHIKEEIDAMKEAGEDVDDSNNPVLKLNENKQEMVSALDEALLMLREYSGVATRVKFDTIGESARMSFFVSR